MATAADSSDAASPSSSSLIKRLVSTVDEISAIPDHRNAYRKSLCSLARRIKLLAPMFDELADAREPISDDALQTLAPLDAALAAANDLLHFAGDTSKIFLVLERDKMVTRIHEVTTQLEEALTIISFDKLNISDEVREQVELVHTQFRRAKERADTLDVELYNDLCSLYNNQEDVNEDPAVLGKVAESLPLATISDLKQESLALHEMVFDSDGDPGEKIEKMSRLLKKIKDFVLTQNPDVGTNAVSDQKNLIPGVKQITPLIPDDFRCPISLELMTDPVIVSSGQTFERSYIEKWLASGHDTCPKTQQRLSSAQITPNYVLRSLIAQWCEANGLESPKRPLQPSGPAPACSSSEHPNIEALLPKLLSSNLEDQRSATAQLRLLAKRSASNRICIAKAGAIPLLKKLLSAGDLRTQEHAVTALLNLSICEENKSIIMQAGAVPDIVHVLRNGSMEARENAAATLFSLSVVDEYKIAIGLSGAIHALVELLREGTQRGKKDAATALFNLCIFQGNKAKAVRAGIVPLIMGLLMDPAGSMVDEALAVLAILSSHPEGKTAIAATEAVPVLVDVVGSGSPRNKENAAAILLNLCCGEQQIPCLSKAHECGLMGPLQELALSGTDRGKRKAAQLLERVNRFSVLQSELLAQAQASSQATHTISAPSQVNVEAASEAQSVKPATSERLDM